MHPGEEEEEEEDEEEVGVAVVGEGGASSVAVEDPPILLQGEATHLEVLITTDPDQRPPPPSPCQYSHQLEKVRNHFLVLTEVLLDRWIRGNRSLSSIIYHTRWVEKKTRYGTTYTSGSDLQRQMNEEKVEFFSFQLVQA